MFNAMVYNEKMEKTGFTKEQSYVLIEVLSDMVDNNFATKADLNEFKLITRHDFDDLRKDMNTQFIDLRKDMDNRFTEVRKDMGSMEASLRKDMKSMEDRLTIRLTSVMVILVGLLYTIQNMGKL